MFIDWVSWVSRSDRYTVICAAAVFTVERHEAMAVSLKLKYRIGHCSAHYLIFSSNRRTHSFVSFVNIKISETIFSSSRKNYSFILSILPPQILSRLRPAGSPLKFVSVLTLEKNLHELLWFFHALSNDGSLILMKLWSWMAKSCKSRARTVSSKLKRSRTCSLFILELEGHFPNEFIRFFVHVCPLSDSSLSVVHSLGNPSPTKRWRQILNSPCNSQDVIHISTSSLTAMRFGERMGLCRVS
jgi:hypothetical protein